MNVSQNAISKGTKMLEKFDKKTTSKLIKSLSKTSENDEDFLWKIYQSYGDLVSRNTPDPDKMGWNHAVFKEHKMNMEEHDGYIVSPFQVSEGVVECPKCHKCKTFSFQ